jgi:hypothetical protein
MKRAWILFALAAALLAAPAFKRAGLIALEKSFDQRIRSLADDPYILLGPTRGVYLEGYGAVFTAEVNLANGPRPSPFQPIVGKDGIAKIHKLKLERLPVLRQNMREMLMAAASSLDEVPAKEQIVVGVSLVYYAEEDATGMPGQILMQGERGKLIDAKLGRIPLDTVVKAKEF